MRDEVRGALQIAVEVLEETRVVGSSMTKFRIELGSAHVDEPMLDPSRDGDTQRIGRIPDLDYAAFPYELGELVDVVAGPNREQNCTTRRHRGTKGIAFGTQPLDLV